MNILIVQRLANRKLGGEQFRSAIATATLEELTEAHRRVFYRCKSPSRNGSRLMQIRGRMDVLKEAEVSP